MERRGADRTSTDVIAVRPTTVRNTRASVESAALTMYPPVQFIWNIFHREDYGLR